jgi:hypothetical protein
MAYDLSSPYLKAYLFPLYLSARQMRTQIYLGSPNAINFEKYIGKGAKL